MRGRLLALAIGTIAAAVTASAASARVPVVPMPPSISWDARFAPKRLSGAAPTPATLHLSFETSPSEGSRSPALTKLVFGFDRNSRLNLGRLPACSGVRLQDEHTLAEKCAGSEIGDGEASIAIALPESEELFDMAPVHVFKAGPGAILLDFHLSIPTPAEAVASGQILSSPEGRYARQLELTMPKIAGGFGSISKLDLQLGRQFTVNGRRQSVLTARCPSSRQLHVGLIAAFASGSTLSADAVHSCGREGR